MTQDIETRCTREDGYWVLTVPAVPGVHTAARTLTQAEDMVRDAVAAVCDLPAEQVTVTLDVTSPRLDDLHRARAATDEAEHALLTQLFGENVTHRDIARITGLTTTQVSRRARTWRESGKPGPPRSTYMTTRL